MRPVDDTEWARVGDAVRARRESQGMTQLELARAADVSDSTIRVLETARRTSYRAANLRAIARALGWPDDALDRIRAGRPADERLVPTDSRAIEARLDELEGELAELRAALARQRS